MAKKSFSASEWKKINNLTEKSAEKYGLPKRRKKSVVIGTFNIRELGKIKKRSSQSWDFLEKIINRFDLLAVQEVMDDLEGLNNLRDRLGRNTGMVVSDVTGVFPGDRGNAERLAFLFNWKRIGRTELASDITYDRSKVVKTLFENRASFQKAWKKHVNKLKAWEKKVKEAKDKNKKKPKKPSIVLPMFLNFIRQPHCSSFQVISQGSAKPLNFLAVNAHLLYGENKDERKWEFDALIEWLTIRAKQSERMYYKNIIMMGDCNLEFGKANIKRNQIDAQLKSLNKTALKSKKAAKVNFPLLSKHPKKGFLETNARQNKTYDQIAIFAHDKRLPTYKDNDNAGQKGKDSYDYGVFRFTDLFAMALYNDKFDNLSKQKQKDIIKKCEFDVSDHMPAWIRLPKPGV